MTTASGQKIHSAGDDEDENIEYDVVTDIEERYSIWPSASKLPPYWKKEGFTGKKKECLDYIQNVWTDMRPLSLRKEMAKWEEEFKKRQPREEKLKQMAEERERAMAEGIDHFHKAQPPNELVRRLMKRQEIEVIRYRNRETGAPDVKKLTAAVNRGYVLVKFPWTQGGTELGASLDTTGSGKPDPGSFDFSVPGKLSIKGRLKLDYTPVQLHAIIDLETFGGEGWLEIIPNWKSPQEFRNEEKLEKLKAEQKQKEEEEAKAKADQQQ